jgi:hypothetical protein
MLKNYDNKKSFPELLIKLLLKLKLIKQLKGSKSMADRYNASAV